VRFRESSLEDPLEESFAQFEFDLDLDIVHEQAKALLDPAPEMRTGNGEEEKKEQFEPPQILNWPNDKEMSTEAHSFVTIPLETYHSHQVPSFQCLEEPSYVEIFKESHTEDHKSMNRVPKWIPRNKDSYIRWRNILPEGMDWLDTHMSGEGAVFFFFIFRTAFLFFIFVIFMYIFNLFQFLTTINLLMFDL
jgi:hypothetical protein